MHDAAELAAAAFLDSLAYDEIYRVENLTERFEHMREFFYRNFLLTSWSSPQGIHSFYSERSGRENDTEKRNRLDVFFMLVPSTERPSLWLQIQAGLLMLFWISGWTIIQRLIKAGDFCEEQEREIMQGKGKYLSLQRMMVAPELQGKGLGSAKLGQVLHEVADKEQLPVVLETQREKNVRFYTKL